MFPIRLHLVAERRHPLEHYSHPVALDDLPDEPDDDELAGLTPTLYEHVNSLGTYTFNTDRRRTAPATALSQRRMRFH
jgi:hypothetical protein